MADQNGTFQDYTLLSNDVVSSSDRTLPVAPLATIINNSLLLASACPSVNCHFVPLRHGGGKVSSVMDAVTYAASIDFNCNIDTLPPDLCDTRVLNFPAFPAAFSLMRDNMVSVHSISPNGDLAKFASYGMKTTHLGASERITYVSGSSMAAALVSGAVGWIFQLRPDLQPSQYRSDLQLQIRESLVTHCKKTPNLAVLAP